MGDFTENSVAFGLKDREFSHIAEGDKQKLIRLMARISEKSYRRGFQHGCVLDPAERLISPEELRFEWSLDKSPYTDCGGGDTSIARLFMECGVLHDIGFYMST